MSNPWFWISFSSDAGFLGGCYVESCGPLQPDPLPPHVAESDYPFIRALSRSHDLGINPGGEAQGMGPIPEDALFERVPEKFRNRLLSKDELRSIGGFTSTEEGEL